MKKVKSVEVTARGTEELEEEVKLAIANASASETLKLEEILNDENKVDSRWEDASDKSGECGYGGDD